MSIRIFDGKWLLSGSQLATDDNCCCGDEPPPPQCSGSCDEENSCPGGCYCCDGECQEEPCEGECTSETLAEPCGDDPYDGTDGFLCCYNQVGTLGCYPFPPDVYACESDDWCSNCGEPATGGVATRLGPYLSSFEAGTAATAWFLDNCAAGSTENRSCDGGATWYGFICCTDEAP